MHLKTALGSGPQSDFKINKIELNWTFSQAFPKVSYGDYSGHSYRL